ncbi:MAG: MarR family winged helix-turn-helix transcriptional regulator [Acidimicrobiia bacterium]
MSVSYSFGVGRPVRRLSALVTVVDDRVRAAIEEASGFTGAAPDALMTIGLAPGLRVEDLALMLRVSHSGAVRALDRLAEAGLVDRHVSGTDRRAVEVRLTALGRRRRQLVIDARNRVIDGIVALLHPEGQDALGGIVDEILGRLSPELADHSLCRLCDPDDCAEQCPVEDGADPVPATETTLPHTGGGPRITP